jgi:hypothetical protein
LLKATKYITLMPSNSQFVVENTLDKAGAVDDVTHTLCGSNTHTAMHAIKLDHLFRGVTYEGKRHAGRDAEPSQGLLRVGTHTNHLGSKFRQVIVVLTERTGLPRSTGGESLGEEIQDHVGILEPF